MTDKTKKLFDAPWTVTREEIRKDTVRYGVAKSHLDLVAIDLTHEDAHRLARLPELYDALANAVRDACQDCVDQVYDHPTGYDPVKQGCLFKDKNCCEMCRSWIELLRKVRDGK